MDVAELHQRFAIPGVLAFEKTASGLMVARVTAPAAEATIYLQGAHVTHWKPVGQAPVEATAFDWRPPRKASGSPARAIH